VEFVATERDLELLAEEQVLEDPFRFFLAAQGEGESVMSTEANKTLVRRIALGADVPRTWEHGQITINS